jgi:hypothetical protein
MVDPLAVLFDGRTTRELVDAGEPVACHGPLERLPVAFRSGLLASAEHLAQHFTGTVQIANGSATAGGQLPVGRASAGVLLELGLTVAFDALQDHVDGLRTWAGELERALGAPARCVRLMGFANAPGTGLTLHHDVHDQLLIHLQGHKTLHWARNEHLRTPSERFSHGSRPARGFGANYAEGFPPTAEAVVSAGMEAVELRPGTVLFVPGGTWHTTAGQTEQTLSVAVIAEVPSVQQVLLETLAWDLAQHAEGRRRAYGGWSDDPGDALAAVRSLADDLAARLHDLDLRKAFATWQLGRSFAHHELYPADTAFERYVRLPFAQVQTRPSDDGEGLLVRVRCGRATYVHADTTLLTLPEARAVVDWIAACHRAFTVAELREAVPAFPADELPPLLGALGQAQWIRPLPTPPWPEADTA